MHLASFTGLWCLLATGTSALLAFPGAEGFGRNALGGRTGTVYKVTNLNDSGAGSLRDAVSQPNRIVVFTVGGVITITDRIVVSKNIYIAGQTAPGGGITVYGDGFSWSNANEAIVRYIRVRMGKGGTSGKDAITIAEGKNMIFDHVSVSWGRDETFSVSGTAQNISIQNSIIAQGLETHSCGGLMETDGGISLFRNLYIDNKTRNPKVSAGFPGSLVRPNVSMQSLVLIQNAGQGSQRLPEQRHLQLGRRRRLHRRRQRGPELCQYHQQLLHQRTIHFRNGVHAR